MLFAKDTLPTSSTSCHQTIELIRLEIRLRQGSLLVGLFYRPPFASTTFNNPDQAFEDIPSYPGKSVVLIGDFKLDLLADRQLSSGHCSLSDFAAKHSLSQVVSDPTRVTDNSANLIDHVYASDVALLESCCSAPLASSDHRSVLVSLSWSQTPVRKHHHLVWSYSADDYEAANDELARVPSSIFSTSDINQHLSQWKDLFLNLMLRHIPSRNGVTRKCLPWLYIRILINKGDRLFHKVKSSALLPAWEAFRKSRN